MTDPQITGTENITETGTDAHALVRIGVHADGSPCFHSLSQIPPTEVLGDGHRWHTCTGNLLVLPDAQPGAPVLGENGWELTPTPCPECGAADEVLVRHEPVPVRDGDVLAQGVLEDGPWSWHCQVCSAYGTGYPKAKAQEA